MELTDQQIALMRRFREIMPIHDPLLKEREKIISLPYKKEILIRSNRDIYREVAYLYFLKNKLLDYVRVLHVYQLVDVYLDNSSKWDSLFQISDPIVVILLGYNEMENKRTNEILNQYIAYRKDDPLLKCLMIFYKGTDLIFDTKYGKKSQLPLVRLPYVDLYGVSDSSSKKKENQFEF